MTDPVAVELQRAESGGRPHGGQGDQRAARAMERQQLVEPHVADAVAVGQHEGAAADERLQLPQPAAGQRRFAGVHQMDLPRLRSLLFSGATWPSWSEIVMS